MVQGVAIDNNNCIVNIDPATGDEISRIPCSTASEVNQLVENAQSALSSWSLSKDNDRIDCLQEGLKNLKQQHDVAVDMIVREMGKPRAEAVEEMEGAVEKDDYMHILRKAQQPERHGSSLVLRQAIGVVVVISPWNYPVDEILLLALPALAAGNTVIVKPSEVTPECGALTVQALAAALPDNVLQLAQGDGTVGAHLVSHDCVNMVAMTGSSATGKKILKSAASTLKRVVLELGGKDPMLVFDDANLEQAAHDAVDYSLSNTGQVCCSVERIFVAENVLPEFQEKVVERARTFLVGNGMNPDVKVGPMVSMLQKDHVAAQVKAAVEEGATLLYQSTTPSSNQFFPVTVLSNVTPIMDVMRTETFGPVVALSAFDGTEASGIQLANDTEYGLAGSVYTKNVDRAQRVATQMQCGQVGINCYPLNEMNVACPWYVYVCMRCMRL